MPRKNRIILSYRRSDSDVITGRIRDRLASRYGDDAVFMDIENIPLGFDYRRQIKAAILENRVFIAVIGPKWIGGSGKDARINEENDPVRIEVETALQQGLPIIPVLVSGGTMPKSSDLPPSLQSLCYLNAAEVDGGRDFHPDMDRLIQAIDRIAKSSEAAAPRQSRIWLPVALTAIGCLLLAVIGILAYPAVSAYFEARKSTQVAVQPAAQPATLPNPAPAPQLVPAPPVQQLAPTPPPQPAPAPQPTPAPQLVIAPPPFSTASCKPSTASLYDDFHKPDVGWNIAPSDPIRYVDGQLAMTLKPKDWTSLIYMSLRYQNATVCGHIKSPPQVKSPADAVAGFIFWAFNYDNYYLVEISVDGKYAVFRRLDAAWITVVPFTKSEHVNSGADAVNEIRVQLVDNFGALFINGVKITEFRGQPPKGGGAVGMHSEAEDNFASEWRFLDIAIMDNGPSKQVTLPPSPSGPTIGDCRPVNGSDFQDTFASPNPGWGINDPESRYVDGQLSIKADANNGFTELYRSLVFRNATVCVTVKSPTEVTDMEDWASGGATFWAKDYRNYYIAKVFPNGTFNVSRKVDGDFVTVVPRTASDKVKKGVGAVNNLQVVLNSANATLYINGASVGTFRGQPPADGSATGIFAQSETHKADDWRFLNFTVIENQ